jgi:hypothetical protein
MENPRKMHAEPREARSGLLHHGMRLAKRGGDMKTNPHTRRPGLAPGKIGWILLWLIGVPVPVLLVLFLLRGCT